jgi:hypothetical protein
MELFKTLMRTEKTTWKSRFSSGRVPLSFDETRFQDLFGLFGENKLRKKTFSRKVVGYPWSYPLKIPVSVLLIDFVESFDFHIHLFNIFE